MKFALTLSIVLAACGGSKPPASSTDTPLPSNFADMNHEQQERYMEQVVLPTMKPMWAAFDPKLPEMTCATCHGDDTSHEMPNAKLPKLPATEEAFTEYAKDPEHGRWAKFMFEQVTPKMAELLQQKPFDPQTQSGDFSCDDCHTLLP